MRSVALRFRTELCSLRPARGKRRHVTGVFWKYLRVSSSCVPITPPAGGGAQFGACRALRIQGLEAEAAGLKQEPSATSSSELGRLVELWGVALNAQALGLPSLRPSKAMSTMPHIWSLWQSQAAAFERLEVRWLPFRARHAAPVQGDSRAQGVFYEPLQSRTSPTGLERGAPVLTMP